MVLSVVYNLIGRTDVLLHRMKLQSDRRTRKRQVAPAALPSLPSGFPIFPDFTLHGIFTFMRPAPTLCSSFPEPPRMPS